MSDKLDELLLEREWRRCFPEWERPGESFDERVERLSGAFMYFCESFWSIRHPSRGRIKFELRDAQRQTVDAWLRERFTLALKARQIGFSTLSGAFAFWLTFGWSDRPVIMISRNEREAAKLLQKSKYGYRFLPDWMKLRGPIVYPNVTRMGMTNESYIESLPSASDPARGESVFAIFVDEIGFLPNSEEAWASIEPVADVGAQDPDPLGGGRVIMLGTANGEGNLLHREWVKSRGGFGNGTGRFWGIFHNWRAGGRDDAWYEAKKRELPEWQLAQEYPDNPEEAFLKSGRPVFDLAVLRAVECEQPSRGYLRETKSGGVEFVEDGGSLRVWREPEPRHRYSVGVDVAEGLENGDFSSVHVIDAKTGEVVAHWHGHVDADLLGSEIVPLLGRWYNQALVVVEANNHGGTTLHALRRCNYFPLFYRRKNDNRHFRRQTDQMGWLTTPKSKGLAIDELNMALRDGDLTVLDAETIAELRTFVREGDGRMNGSNGSHDDRVMSLAIANQGLKFVHLHEYQPRDEPGPGTFGWWMRQSHLWDDDEGREDFIGSRAVRVSV